MSINPDSRPSIGLNLDKTLPSESIRSPYKTQTQQIVDKLNQLGHPADQFKTNFETFFETISVENGPSGVGLLWRYIGRPFRPIIDVNVRWSQELTAELLRSSNMNSVSEAHGPLAISLLPHLDTYLEHVDPRFVPTIEEFTEALKGWGNAYAEKFEILACFDIRPIPKL